MEFRVLGPVEVAAGEHATRLGRGHRRTILASLLASWGAIVTTERLIEDVWDGAPPASARKSLQSHLSRLRDDLRGLDGAASPTHQLTTLRNLVVLLAELDEEEPAAVLHGAVTAGLTPSFGTEARRLEDAWQRLESRMGGSRASEASERGRTLGPTEMGEFALGHLDGMLDR